MAMVVASWYRVSLAACVLLLAGKACAATLRPFTTLAAPVVRLSDLFTDAGSEAGRVLGPAPAPGTRISVEAPQLAAIAREYGVAWRPETGFDRAVLVRPGTPLAEAPVVAALRKALVGLGAAADGAVELDGFQPPMLPVGAAPVIVVEQLSYDANQGGFQGALAIAVPDEPAVSVPVAGRSVQRVMLTVAAHRLEPGTALGPGDFTQREVADPAARGAVLRDPEAAFGRAVRHMVVAGAPVALDNLVSLPTIAHGQRVSMEIAAPGITVTAIGVALTDGGTGETVEVLNPISRAVVRAAVLGPGRVSVAEGSMPLRPAGAFFTGLGR